MSDIRFSSSIYDCGYFCEIVLNKTKNRVYYAKMDNLKTIPREVRESGFQLLGGGLIICDFSYSKRAARGKTAQDFIRDLVRCYKFVAKKTGIDFKAWVQGSVIIAGVKDKQNHGNKLIMTMDQSDESAEILATELRDAWLYIGNDCRKPQKRTVAMQDYSFVRTLDEYACQWFGSSGVEQKIEAVNMRVNYMQRTDKNNDFIGAQYEAQIGPNRVFSRRGGQRQ